MTSTNIKMTSAHMRRDQREEMEHSVKESSCSNNIWRHTVIFCWETSKLPIHIVPLKRVSRLRLTD